MAADQVATLVELAHACGVEEPVPTDAVSGYVEVSAKSNPLEQVGDSQRRAAAIVEREEHGARLPGRAIGRWVRDEHGAVAGTRELVEMADEELDAEFIGRCVRPGESALG
jgi:hypothetical protein